MNNKRKERQNMNEFSEGKLDKQKEKSKKGKVTVKICGGIILTLVLIIFLIEPIQYNRALKFIEKEEYSKAYDIFYKLKDYKNTEELLEKFMVVHGETIKHYSSIGKRITKYYYDNNGNCIKEIETLSDGKNVVTNKVYDLNNNCIKSTLGNSVTEYQYDTYGNLIKETTDNDVNPSREYYYDIKDNLVQQILFYSDGHTSTIDYSYDESNNRIREVFTVPLGQTIAGTNGDNEQITEYTYDKNGNCIRITIGEDYVEEYVYNKENNIIKKILSHSEIEYKYDDRGVCIREIETYFDGSGQTITEHKDFKVFYRESN